MKLEISAKCGKDASVRIEFEWRFFFFHIGKKRVITTWRFEWFQVVSETNK